MRDQLPLAGMNQANEAASASERIEFVIPMRLTLLNPTLRSHWSRRRKVALMLAWEVAVALPMARRPKTPWARANVRIERTSPKTPDRDNLYGSAKPLLDILQPLHAKCRPLGLGVIENDSDTCIDLVVVHVPGTQARTRVVLTRL